MKDDIMNCKECGHKNVEDANFCEECGKKNKNDSVFCENCGVKFNKGFDILSIYNGKYKSIKIIGTVVALVLIMIIVVLKSVSSPDATIKSFCSAIKKHDYKKIYGLLYLPKSEFLSKTKFEDYFSIDERIEIASCKGKRVEDTEPTVMKYEVILTNPDNEKAELEITLSKKKNRKFLLFNNWGIYSENMIVSEWKVTVPRGSTLYIDGVKINNKVSETSTTDEYIIKNLFKTSYQVKVTHPLSDDEVEDNELPVYDLVISNSDINIKDAIKKKTDEIKNIVSKIQEVALISNDYNSLNDILASNHKIDIEDFAQSIKEQIDSYSSYSFDVKEYKNINITDLRIISSKIIDEETVQFDTRFTTEYEYLLENQEEFFPNSKVYYSTLDFKVKDNNLLLYGID